MNRKSGHRIIVNSDNVISISSGIYVGGDQNSPSGFITKNGIAVSVDFGLYKDIEAALEKYFKIWAIPDRIKSLSSVAERNSYDDIWQFFRGNVFEVDEKAGVVRITVPELLVTVEIEVILFMELRRRIINVDIC